MCTRTYVPHRHSHRPETQRQRHRQRQQERQDSDSDSDSDRKETETETETSIATATARETESASLAAESIRTDAIIMRFAFPMLLPTLVTTGRIMIAAACPGRCVSICTFVPVKHVN